MRSIFTKTALAALIGLGSIAAVPAVASAHDHVRVIVDHGPRHHMDERRFCSNREAVWRAERSGMRRALVVARSPNRIVLEGQRGYRKDRMVVADRPGCPIVRR
jgi:hypothetical protein